MVLKTDLFEEALGNDALASAIPKAFVGMDLSSAVLREARQRHPGLRVVRADARRLPFADAVLDGVVSTSTLDHFHDPADLEGSLQELGRVLRPGAELLLTLDNPWNPLLAVRNALPHALRTAVGLTPYYVGYTCGPARVEKLLCQAGFTVRETTSILHFPRALIAVVGQALGRTQAGLVAGTMLGLLRRAEVLRHLPTRWLTGHYVAVRAVKLAKDNTSSRSARPATG
jgi:SAM-dependent methyltransferase